MTIAFPYWSSHRRISFAGEAAHVRGCARCSGLVRALADADHASISPESSVAIGWPHAVVADLDADPQPGAVHSIWGDEDGDLLAAVIIDVDDREALVVPVSPETHFAGDADVLIDPTVLAYPAMLEIWNHVQVLREQVMERIGQLNGDLIALDAAVDAVIDSRPLPPELRQGVAVGGEADPRRLFREEEARRIQKFVEPWRILNVADTLGTVLAARRVKKDLPTDAVAEQADLSADVVARLEADQQNLRAGISISHMDALARWFGLCPSQRLGDLVERAVFDNDRGPAADAQLAMARRRRGTRSANRCCQNRFAASMPAITLDSCLPECGRRRDCRPLHGLRRRRDCLQPVRHRRALSRMRCGRRLPRSRG